MRCASAITLPRFSGPPGVLYLFRVSKVRTKTVVVCFYAQLLPSRVLRHPQRTGTKRVCAVFVVTTGRPGGKVALARAVNVHGGASSGRALLDMRTDRGGEMHRGGVRRPHLEHLASGWTCLTAKAPATRY